MQTLSFYYRTENRYSEAVQERDFLLRCIPQDLPEQKILEMTLLIEPDITGGNYGTDSFGNRTYTGRIPQSHDSFSYLVKGSALRNDAEIKESVPLPIYSYSSPLTQASPLLEQLLATVPEDMDIPHLLNAIQELVHHSIVYESGATDVHTTASQALLIGKGVCQDFTHIFLALCRMRHIPARYVSGLPVGEGASHAWAEAWFDGKWHGYDPTRCCMVDETYLKFCTGRDFHDCPIEQGVFYGCTLQEQSVYAKVSSRSI